MLQDVPKIIFSQWSIFPGSYSSQGPMPSASSVPKMLLGCCVPSMSLRAYSMFPESYVSQYPVSGSHVPSGLCSQGEYVFWGDLWFPRPYVPMGLRSQGLRVHKVYVPKGQGSKDYLLARPLGTKWPLEPWPFTAEHKSRTGEHTKLCYLPYMSGEHRTCGTWEWLCTGQIVM